MFEVNKIVVDNMYVKLLHSKINNFDGKTSSRFGIFENEKCFQKNAVKKLAIPLDVFHGKSMIWMAARPSALSIFAFQV